MVPQLPANVKKHHMTVAPVAVTGSVLGLPIYVFLVLLVVGLQFSWLCLLVGAASGILAGLLVADLGARIFPTALSEDGIYGYSVWGCRRFVCWENITHVRPFAFLSCRYLRVHDSRDGAVTWLPLFQARPDEFRQDICTLAPAGNPLLSYFL